MLKNGLYEQVINKDIDEELKVSNRYSQKAAIDEIEASKILTKYVSEIIEKGLETVKDNGGNLAAQVDLINRIVNDIESQTQEKSFNGMSVATGFPEQLLLGVFDKDHLVKVRPETSIAQSSLFTGASHEPQLYAELKKEIITCDRVDMLVSFIKWSGLRLIINALSDFTKDGHKLRIITTSYMGATDVKAIEELRKLPNTEIKISYDTNRTRLHAKTYVFYRDTGFTTAYVGSSNLSNAAISSGLEWNLKITRQDLPETIEKITATFDSYWNSNEFVYYDESQKEILLRALKAEKFFKANDHAMYTMDIQPYPYQQEILDKLAVERIRGHMRNLVVAATGTGKTVISAFDYKRFQKANPDNCKLLFVAHREEILRQSLDTFRSVLKDANFGELYVGGQKPEDARYVFMSIQTFNRQNIAEKTASDYYDFIIVDEFHHAAAPTYKKLLEHFHSKILLGLTATPERMDGVSILPYFEDRIAAEIRLPEAIDRKLLSPFQYFGVTDTIDLDRLKWTNGGYDKAELSKLYSESGKIANTRADWIVSALLRYSTDIEGIKGLGFCVSKTHTRFMAQYFNDCGIPSMSLTEESSDEDRRNAKKQLVDGKIRFIFVVDLYNEGVDIPEVNTVLFLRPTESLTVFLQQLGRGLRLAEGKECLTVLDFVGRANKKYNFEGKFAALLSNMTRSITSEIKDGFLSLPKGCYIQLEKEAMRYILEVIKKSTDTKDGLKSRIATFEEDTKKPLTLSEFLNYYHINPRHLYYKKTTFFELCADVKHTSVQQSILNDSAHKILYRLCTIDSPKWISFLKATLPIIETLSLDTLKENERLMLKMLYVSIWEKPFEKLGFKNEIEGIVEFKNCTELYNEFDQILDYNNDHISVMGKTPDLGYDCPLEIYCSYTRAQILAGLDFLDNYTVSEGVKYLKEKNTDVLFITLNKTNKYYSPTTSYKDYSINENLFHWQSQSTTSEKSSKGLRYMSTKESNGKVLLFVRELKTDNDGPQPFVFIGNARYVSHNGSRPMNIVWHLDSPIPAKLISITNKLLGG